MKIPFDVVNAGPAVIERYQQMIDSGESPRIAEMLALNAAPRGMTDDVFFGGAGMLQKQFSYQDETLAKCIKVSKRHGYTPNANDVYNPALAAFPGDPLAFVPATGGRGHIRKVCEMRGWSCDGAVTVKGREPESDPHQVRIDPKRKKNKQVITKGA